MPLEDIRAMRYISDLSVELIDVYAIPGLTVNSKRKRWSYESARNIPIGQSQQRFGLYGKIRQGIIGVYDINKPEHLKRMLIDVEEATK